MVCVNFVIVKSETPLRSVDIETLSKWTIIIMITISLWIDRRIVRLIVTGAPLFYISWLNRRNINLSTIAVSPALYGWMSERRQQCQRATEFVNPVGTSSQAIAFAIVIFCSWTFGTDYQKSLNYLLCCFS